MAEAGEALEKRIGGEEEEEGEAVKMEGSVINVQEILWKVACLFEVTLRALLIALHRPMARVPGEIQVVEGVLHLDAIFDIVEWFTGVEFGQDLLQLLDAVVDVVAKDSAIEFWH